MSARKIPGKRLKFCRFMLLFGVWLGQQLCHETMRARKHILIGLFLCVAIGTPLEIIGIR